MGCHGSRIGMGGCVEGWCCDFYGQATVPSGVYQAIAAGSDHSLGIRHDDTLTGWGDNIAGQSNVSGGAFTAVAAGTLHSLGLRTDEGVRNLNAS